ncbi:hypothetical protein CPT_Shaeky_028 [Streptomyces phage Shaeky]|uniref:Uncharacterized protein n=1 Tax=Streptomyces phage Shaeky TaxID=2767586 RepID=A0A873WNS9_9CAUD|nr:hypothetical protein CPT_Shaeky_028 [Streptomyces phage Shaeky]
MAFYLVTDGRKNQYGEADMFVVRASGVRQAVSLAPVLDAKGAEVTKLEDGRDVPHGVILSALADFADETPDAPAVIETEATEVAEVTSGALDLPETVSAPVSPGYAVI